MISAAALTPPLAVRLQLPNFFLHFLIACFFLTALLLYFFFAFLMHCFSCAELVVPPAVPPPAVPPPPDSPGFGTSPYVREPNRGGDADRKNRGGGQPQEPSSYAVLPH